MDARALDEKGDAAVSPDPWDPVVRITHWSIVLTVVVNYFLVKPGGTIHVWVGWVLLAVLAVRLVWGLFGPPEARFSAFPPDPRAALSHLWDLLRGRAKTYPTHNPAGAAMAYALWACLAVLVATGLVMTGGKSPVTIAEEKAAVAAGEWSALVENDDASHDGEGSDMADLAEEIHEVAANLVLFLALLHIAGVAAESRVLRRNLLRPMLFGRDGP